MFKNFFCVICFILTSSAFSYGLGISNYPMLVDKKMISAEATGIFSSGGGMGFQGRFTQKVSQKLRPMLEWGYLVEIGLHDCLLVQIMKLSLII